MTEATKPKGKHLEAKIVCSIAGGLTVLALGLNTYKFATMPEKDYNQYMTNSAKEIVSTVGKSPAGRYMNGIVQFCSKTLRDAARFYSTGLWGLFGNHESIFKEQEKVDFLEYSK